jgi:hypothetical protein
MRRFAISGVVCLPSLVAAVALADAPLRLNEIRLEQPGIDFDEYIEIAGAPGESLTGLSIVVIGDDDFAFPGQQNGYIEDVIPLDGSSVAASGFFVVAEGKFSLGTANLVADLNLEGGDNVTFLLVRDFSGFEGQKLDTNDDGVLDVTPWSSLVSSVAVVQTLSPNGSKTDFYYSTNTVGPDAGDAPAAAWLCANTTQWIVGTADPLGGVDSPGAANQLCVPQGVIINEIRIDQNGTDNNEYFELKGAPGESLDGYTFITIGDSPGSGIIENIVPLNGYVIQADGLLSVAESTFTLTAGYGTADVLLPASSTLNPINFENGDNVTHLLVQGFTGTLNQDIDTNNDGVLDITPWSSISDSVAMTVDAGSVPSANEVWWYSSVRVGPDGAFVPGHIYRCTSAGTWLIGPFGSQGQIILDTAGSPNGNCTTCGPGAGNCHEVHETPGCVDTTCCNSVVTADPTCGSDTWDQACVNLARQFCLVAGNPPVLTLNEIRLDEVGTADANEYIEIKGNPGTNLNGVSVVVVGDGADLNGSVETVISLNNSSIPKDGVFLLAKSTLTLATPDSVKTFNLENGDSVTYFLVWNWTGLINTDYDLDNDCTLDSLPWDATIDSVGIRAGDNRCVYSANTVGPDYVGLPGHVVKCTSGAWRFGRFDVAAVDGFGTPGTANTVCPPAYACGNPNGPSCFAPQTTPGCSDEACCASVCAVDVTCCELAWDASCAAQATLNCFVPANPPDVNISEVRIDQVSFDDDEYFEIVGAPDTLLNGLTYIVIGDGATALGSGVIEFAVSLNGNRIPESGFFLAARPNFDLGGATPDLVLPASPEFENSDNVTHMLVWGFTGALNQDLDTNDDGELDVTPWLEVIQSIALIESAAVPPVNTEYAYGAVRVGPDPNGFVPSQLAYCPSTDTWSIGTFDPAGKGAIDTPGAGTAGCDYASTPCPADIDGDGTVGATDIAILLGSWGSAKGGAADIDGDGAIGALDLAALLAAWGDCP